MSVTVSFTPHEHLATLVFEGSTTFDEWRVAMDAALQHEHFLVGMCIISDRRASQDVPTPIYVRALVGYLKAHADAFAGCGVALVTDGLADYGMSRMAEILSDETVVKVRAFSDIHAARAWLGEFPPG